MDLYYSPISSYSHKVKMALHEKGIEFNAIAVNLADPAQRQSLRDLWPMGKLPFLRHGEEGVGESSSIVEWLDLTFPEKPLFPADPGKAREVRYWDRIADQYISANAITLFFQSLKAPEQQDEERITVARTQLAGAYVLLDQALVASSTGLPFWLQDSPTAGTIALVCALTVSQVVLDYADKPNLVEFVRKAQDRESFQRAREGFEDAVNAMIAARKQ